MIYFYSVLLALLISLVNANIVDLNDFRLSPFVLVKKQDFTYDSGVRDEEFAAAKFDLALKPQNTNQDLDYALMIIMADQDGSDTLINLLRNGTSRLVPHEVGVQRAEIEWLDSVETMLDPIRLMFAVYDKVLFKGKVNTTTMYNQTYSIPSEGVFSTFFLFGPHHPIEPEAPGVVDDIDDALGDLVDDIFGEDREKGHKRALTTNQGIDKKKPHLLIQGQMSFLNSFGFLNAD